MHNNDHAVQEMMRGECYRFLAACFYQPKKDILCAEDFLPVLMQEMQEICPAAAPFVKQMYESLTLYIEEELAVEYATLFVGPFGLKAPPYGSIYLDNDRTVMGPSTMETIRLYEEEGLARDKDFSELPDHIAVELEFMYYLSYRQVEALQKGDMALVEEYRHKQEDFRIRYLGQWAPQFCRNIKDGTENAFYLALADCLNEFVELKTPFTTLPGITT